MLFKLHVLVASFHFQVLSLFKGRKTQLHPGCKSSPMPVSEDKFAVYWNVPKKCSLYAHIGVITEATSCTFKTDLERIINRRECAGSTGNDVRHLGNIHVVLISNILPKYIKITCNLICYPTLYWTDIYVC